MPTPLPRPPRFPLLHALHAALDPEGFFRARARHGDPFLLRIPGPGEIVVTGSSEGARDVFTADPAGFATLRQNPIEPILGPGSLILLSGERHARERRLLVPPFHGERMRAYGQIIQDAALAAVDHKDGTTLVAQELTQAITLEVIIRAVFGVQDAGRRRQLHLAIDAMLSAYGPSLVLFPALRRELAGHGPWARFVRAREAFDALMRAEVRRRRAEPGEHEDILGLLLGLRYDDGQPLPDDELLDELRTLLAAGHETTATVLAWALEYVHRDEAVLERLRAELGDGLPAPETLAALPYLGAVASEALRLHPVVPIVLRRLVKPLELRGHKIAAGANVGVAVSLLHGDREVWSRPGEFFPEHFVGRKYTPFEYAPFGGGHRRCLGAAFAAYELRVVLGTLLSVGSFTRVATGKPPRPVLRSITAAPNRPIRLGYAQRRN